MRLLFAALAALALVCPQIARAADFAPSRISDGETTWTDATDTDSGVLYVQGEATCDNTHATNAVWIYRAPSGTKAAAPYAKLPAATSCDNGDGNDSCSAKKLLGGRYIFDPQGTGGSAYCAGEK